MILFAKQNKRYSLKYRIFVRVQLHKHNLHKVTQNNILKNFKALKGTTEPPRPNMNKSRKHACPVNIASQLRFLQRYLCNVPQLKPLRDQALV